MIYFGGLQKRVNLLNTLMCGKILSTRIYEEIDLYGCTMQMIYVWNMLNTTLTIDYDASTFTNVDLHLDVFLIFLQFWNLPKYHRYNGTMFYYPASQFQTWPKCSPWLSMKKKLNPNLLCNLGGFSSYLHLTVAVKILIST